MSLISTPSIKVEELIIEIMSYSVWCLCVSLHTFCALSGLCSYSDVLILSFCLNTSRTVTGVMKIEEHTAVSVTPYLCLIVHLCVCV